MNRKLVLISAVSILLAISAVYLTFCSKYLRIHQIKIEGGERAHLPTLKSITNDCIGENILTVSFDDIKKNSLHLSWIGDVKFIKKLPSTIIVKIDERKPFAQIRKENGRIFWVSKEGYILEEAKSNTEDVKTTIVGVSTKDTSKGERINEISKIQAIRAYMGMPSSFTDRFMKLSFSDTNKKIVLESFEGYQVYLPEKKLPDTLAILRKLLNKIDGSEYIYIDLRFEGKVILMPRNY